LPAELKFAALDTTATEVRPMMWACGDTTRIAPPLGTAILRELTVDGKAFTFASVIDSADRPLSRKSVPVPEQIHELHGTVALDKSVPGRINVNPFLWRENPSLRCPALLGDHEKPLDRLRSIPFYYQLKNRQTVAFPTYSVGFSGVAVPLRYRPGYKADNGEEIVGSVADGLTLGAMIGLSRSSLRYAFVEGSDNTIRESYKFTTGFFVALSKATVTASTSRAAQDTVTRESGFLTWSPGWALLASVRGVELGGFAGYEVPMIGGPAQQWDFRRRWWFGLGLSYDGSR
jgi:hypothetical protein